MVRILVLILLVAGVGLAAFVSLRPSTTTPTASLPAASTEPSQPETVSPLPGPNGKPITAAQQTRARQHISTIVPPEQLPLNIQQAQHFVTAEQLLQLPRQQIFTDAALVNTVSAHTQTVTPAPTDTATQPSVAATLTDVNPQPVNLITVNQGQPQPATTTSSESAAVIRVRAVSDAGLTVTSSHTAASDPAVATPVQTSSTAPPSPLSASVDGSQIRLKELLDHPEAARGKLFYLHAVAQDDDQGLWGIIQGAVTDAFAQGINLGRADSNAASAQIPADADERLSDRRSSFLGHILQRKVRESYIYNYTNGTLGQNPDLIQPGQQLVIIAFSEDELVQIYQYFATP